MTNATALSACSASTLGIIAGNGNLPREIIDACIKNGRPVFVLGFEGATDLSLYADVPHAVTRLGAVNDIFNHLKQANVEEVVMAGGIKRPSLSSLKPDAKGAKLIARMGASFFKGDDALLKQLILFFEEEGFRVISTQDILTDIVAKTGALGIITPTDTQLADIAAGFKAAKALGARDIGQAIIVKEGKIIAEEDAEGTNAMLHRFRKESNGAILVKASKPNQEHRADLPAIGEETIERAHAVGIAGVAIEAGYGLIINEAATIQAADELGIFIYGIPHE